MQKVKKHLRKLPQIFNVVILASLLWSYVAVPGVYAYESLAPKPAESPSETVSEEATHEVDTTTKEVEATDDLTEEEVSEKNEEETAETETEPQEVVEVPSEDAEGEVSETEATEEAVETTELVEETVETEATEEAIEPWVAVDGGYKSTEPVQTGVEYMHPENLNFNIRFSTLPEADSYLYMKVIELTEEQKAETNSSMDYAYELTLTYSDNSEVENGSFTYNLSLPNNGNMDAGVKYSESVNDLVSATEVNEEVIIEGNESVKVQGLNHFTVFVVVTTFEEETDPTLPGYNDEWFGDITRVSSGTDGIPSSEGSYHGVVSGGAYTRWGGYNNEFPMLGYDTSIDVYLNTSLADGSSDLRMDYSSAVNTPSGDHRRDFVFNIGTDPANANQLLASASNNAQGWPGNPGRSPITITETGWYTLEHQFRANASDELVVTMNLYKKGETTPLGTWTLTNSSDVVGSTVGGNRYGWFVPVPSWTSWTDLIATETLAIDNSVYTSYTDEPIEINILQPDVEGKYYKEEGILTLEAEFINDYNFSGIYIDIIDPDLTAGSRTVARCNWNGNLIPDTYTCDIDLESPLNLSGTMMIEEKEYRAKFTGFQSGGVGPTVQHLTIYRTFNVDNTAPEIPVLLSPADGSFMNSSGMVMDWTDVTDPSGDVTYQYQSTWGTYTLGTDNGFISPKYGPRDTGTNSEINASGSTERVYFWQVRACDAVGNCSNWTDPWTVTVDNNPPQISLILSEYRPSNGHYYPHFTKNTGLTFAKPATDDPRYYMTGYKYEGLSYSSLSIAQDSGSNITNVEYRYTSDNGSTWSDWTDANPVDGSFDSKIEEFEYSLDVAPNAKYLFEARTTDQSGLQSTDDFEVYVDTLLPIGGFTGDTPEDGSYVTNGFTIDTTCNGTMGEDSDRLHIVNIAFMKDWSNFITRFDESVNVDPGSYQLVVDDDLVNSLEDGEYTIWMRCMDKGMNSYTEARTIIIDNTPPEQPTGLHILNSEGENIGCGGYVNERRITVDWDDNTETDLDHYDYQIREERTIAEPTDSEFTGNIRDEDGYYKYRVRAVDMAGNTSEWTDWCGVTLDREAPSVPENLTWYEGETNLMCGGYTNSYEITAAWDETTDTLNGLEEDEIAGLSHYEYQSFNPTTGWQWPGGEDGVTITDPTEDGIVERDGRFTVGEGTYGFRVRSVDNAGNKSEWSSTGFETSCQITYDETNPEVSGIEDMSLEEGQYLDEIDWTVFDSISVTDNMALNELYLTLTYTDYEGMTRTETAVIDISILGTGFTLDPEEAALSSLIRSMVSESDVIDTNLFDEGMYSFNYYVTDMAENESNTETFNVYLDNYVPAVYLAASDTAVNEGDTVNFEILFDDLSDWDLEYEGYEPDDAPWDVYLYINDILAAEVTDVENGFIQTETLPITFNLEGTYVVYAEVCEAHTYYEDGFVRGEGECAESTRVTITVTNLAPEVEITADPGTTVTEGTTVTLTASVTSGNEPVSGEWSGDCTGTELSTTVPNTPGTYTCTYTATDVDGDTASDTVTVTVTAAPTTPTTNPVNPVTPATGQVQGVQEEPEEEEEEEEPTDEEDDDKGDVKGQRTCEETRKLSGYIYYDKNNNDERDEDEKGVKDVRVIVYYEEKTEDGTEEVIVDELDTDEEGHWETDVCPGDYKVRVEEDTLPKNVKVDGENVKGVSVRNEDEEVNVNYEVEDQKGFFARYWWILLLVFLLLVAVVLFLLGRNKEE